MAAAFAAIASGGTYHAPTLVQRVVGPGGALLWQHRPSGERVVSPQTARTVLRLLEDVVQGERGTGKAARIPGYLVAGKTGTAQNYASFVGAVPARDPRVVILVGADGPQGGATGGEVAAPAFRRIGERVLARLPPGRPPGAPDVDD